MKPEIKEGDIVKVDFHNAQLTLCYEGKVHHKPCATGDSWIIEKIAEHGDGYDKMGTLYYISEGCTIAKLPPVDKDAF